MIDQADTPTDPSPDLHRDDVRKGFIALTRDLADAGGEEGLTLGQIRDRLDERGFGLLILILSIPCLVPALYGVPQVLGLPIILLAGQILIGRKEPWLPDALLRRRAPGSWLTRMADFAEKRMKWLEHFSKPRLTFLASGFGERMAAVFMILATLTIVLPMTNTVPSIGLALLAVGLIQRDGLFVAGGMAVAFGWASFLAIVAGGLIYGASWAAGFSGLLPQ